MCVATGMTVRCRSDRKRRQCNGKQLSRAICWKKGKDPHPQDKIQHLDFTKDPRPLYYKTPPCVFYHKNVCSKAVFGP